MILSFMRTQQEIFITGDNVPWTAGHGYKILEVIQGTRVWFSNLGFQSESTRKSLEAPGGQKFEVN